MPAQKNRRPEHRHPAKLLGWLTQPPVVNACKAPRHRVYSYTSPCLAICTLKTYVWHEEEQDSVHGAFKRQSADQKDAQHYIRQDSGDVHSLGGVVRRENVFISG